MRGKEESEVLWTFLVEGDLSRSDAESMRLLMHQIEDAAAFAYARYRRFERICLSEVMYARLKAEVVFPGLFITDRASIYPNLSDTWVWNVMGEPVLVCKTKAMSHIVCTRIKEEGFPPLIIQLHYFDPQFMQQVEGEQDGQSAVEHTQ